MKRIATLLFVIVMTSACTRAPFLELYFEDISVPFSGGFMEISIDSNCDWVAESDAEWISVSSKNGDESVRAITLQVAPNMISEERTGTVTVSGEFGSKCMNVHQAAKSVIALDGSGHVDIGSESQTFEVKVASNVEYDINADSDWLRNVTSKSLTSSSFVFEADANPSTIARIGRIVFSDRHSSVEAEFTVRQSGAPQFLRITHTMDKFNSPALFGFEGECLVEWGDGSADSYHSGLSHSYGSVSERTVTLNSVNASTVNFPDMTGITCIDFWDF